MHSHNPVQMFFSLSFSIYSLPVLNKHFSLSTLIWLINWIAQEQCVWYRSRVASLPIGAPRHRIGVTPWSLIWKCALIALATTLFYLHGGERLSNHPSESLWHHRHCLFGVCSLLFDPLALYLQAFYGWYISFHLSHSYIWFLCLFMYCLSNISLHFGLSFIVVDNSLEWEC